MVEFGGLCRLCSFPSVSKSRRDLACAQGSLSNPVWLAVFPLHPSWSGPVRDCPACPL